MDNEKYKLIAFQGPISLDKKIWAIVFHRKLAGMKATYKSVATELVSKSLSLPEYKNLLTPTPSSNE